MKTKRKNFFLPKIILEDLAPFYITLMKDVITTYSCDIQCLQAKGKYWVMWTSHREKYLQSPMASDRGYLEIANDFSVEVISQVYQQHWAKLHESNSSDGLKEHTSSSPEHIKESLLQEVLNLKSEFHLKLKGIRILPRMASSSQKKAESREIEEIFASFIRDLCRFLKTCIVSLPEVCEGLDFFVGLPGTPEFPRHTSPPYSDEARFLGEF